MCFPCYFDLEHLKSFRSTHSPRYEHPVLWPPYRMSSNACLHSNYILDHPIWIALLLWKGTMTKATLMRGSIYLGGIIYSFRGLVHDHRGGKQSGMVQEQCVRALHPQSVAERRCTCGGFLKAHSQGYTSSNKASLLSSSQTVLLVNKCSNVWAILTQTTTLFLPKEVIYVGVKIWLWAD